MAEGSSISKILPAIRNTIPNGKYLSKKERQSPLADTWQLLPVAVTAQSAFGCSVSTPEEDAQSSGLNIFFCGVPLSTAEVMVLAKNNFKTFWFQRQL